MTLEQEKLLPSECWLDRTPSRVVTLSGCTTVGDLVRLRVVNDTDNTSDSTAHSTVDASLDMSSLKPGEHVAVRTFGFGGEMISQGTAVRFVDNPLNVGLYLEPAVESPANEFQVSHQSTLDFLGQHACANSCQATIGSEFMD